MSYCGEFEMILEKRIYTATINLEYLFVAFTQ